MASVDEIERRLHLLRQKLNAGAISSEQFETEVEKLHFTDAIGRAWMIGAQSGKWYYYDGRQWVQSEPPRPAGSVAGSRPTAPATPPRLPSTNTGTDTTRVLTRQPRTVRPRSKAPVGLILGCVVLLLLVVALVVVVVAYWSVLFVPGNQAMGTPSHAFVLPLPDISTATATAPAAVVGNATATPELAGDVAVLIAEAEEMMQSGRWAEATLRFRRSTELEPSLVDGYVGWARALRLGDPQELQEALAKSVIATQLAPRDPGALTELAWDHLALGRLEDAISTAERALAADPNWADASAALAEVFLGNGRLQDGTTRAQLAVQLNAASAPGHLALAHALVLQDQVEPALEHFQAAATLEPGVALFQVELGEQLRRLQRFDEAIKVYQTACALSPNLPRAHDGLARAYFSGPGDFDKALSGFKKAVKIAPDFAPAQSGIGYVYLAKGQPAEAVAAFQKALELAPDLAEARDGLTKAQAAPPEAEPVQVAQAGAPATPKAPKAIKKPPAVKATPAPVGEAEEQEQPQAASKPVAAATV